MFTPKSFELSEGEARAVVRAHPFALLVSEGEDGPDATHLPVLVASETPFVLAFHLARANPQAARLAGARARVVFSGPHAYISPTWYADPASVPTWNYAAVHAVGAPQPMPEERVGAHVREMMRFLEPDLEGNQAASFAPTTVERLLAGLVAFEMRVDRLFGKAKMSQNKTPADRLEIVRALRARGEDDVADWVERSTGTR